MNCYDLKVIYLPNLQTTEERPVTILQEILKWSQSIPTWQQDAIAMLYVKPDISSQDFDDMYALLKSAHGIPDLYGRVPANLAAEHVAAPQTSDRLVQLAAIKNLRNVNALAEDQRLPINRRHKPDGAMPMLIVIPLHKHAGPPTGGKQIFESLVRIDSVKIRLQTAPMPFGKFHKKFLNIFNANS